MKQYKLHVGNGTPDKGFIQTPDFPSFKMLLDTINLSELTLVTFDKEIDNDDYAVHLFTPADCAVELMSRAKGEQLPQCITVGDNKSVSDLINHYVDSYKYDNYCAKIEKSK